MRTPNLAKKGAHAVANAASKSAHTVKNNFPKNSIHPSKTPLVRQSVHTLRPSIFGKGVRNFETASRNRLARDEVLRLSDIEFMRSNRLLLQHVNMPIRDHGRLTIVGENGSGKSTLLKIIAGKVQPTDGEILKRELLSVSYLPQEVSLDQHENTPVFDYALQDTPLSSFFEAQNVQNPHIAIQDKDVLSQFNEIGGFRVSKFFHRLGLGQIDFSRPLGSLSGGERTRLALVNVLLQNPNLLLLDEPTNHLDLQALNWLNKYLKNYSGSVVLVTHDRCLLDEISRDIVELDGKSPIPKLFRGRYKDYLRDKKRDNIRQAQLFHRQEKEAVSLNQKLKKQHARIDAPKLRSANKDPIPYDKIQWFQRATTTKIKQASKRLERLEETRVEMPDPLPQFTWKISSSSDTAQIEDQQPVIYIRDLAKYHDEQCVFKDVSADLYPGQRVVITGSNGAGKTTLLRVICGELQATSGSVRCDPKLRVGYLPQELTLPEEDVTLFDFVQSATRESATEVSSILSSMLFPELIWSASIHNLSVGLQRRAMLVPLLTSNLDVLLLDEPTNHLHPMYAEYLEEQLQLFKGSVLVVSHDRYFIRKFGATIWKMNQNGIDIVEGETTKNTTTLTF